MKKFLKYFGIVFFSLWVLGAISALVGKNDSKKADASLTPTAKTAVAAPVAVAQKNDEKKYLWEYGEQKDEMRKELEIYARIESSNFEKLKWPYGDTFLHLTARKKAGETDVYFYVEKGQIPCHSDCKIVVKFDDGKPQNWAGIGPANSTSSTIFIRNHQKFLKELKASKVMTVEISFYDQGLRQFNFSTDGLKKDF